MVKAFFLTGALSVPLALVQGSQAVKKRLKHKQRRFEDQHRQHALDSTKFHYPQKSFYRPMLTTDKHNVCLMAAGKLWEVCEWEPIDGSSSYRLKPLSLKQALRKKSNSMPAQKTEPQIPGVIWQNIAEFAYDMDQAAKTSGQKFRPNSKKDISEMSIIDRACRQNLIMDENGRLSLDGCKEQFSETSTNGRANPYGKHKFELARFRAVKWRKDEIHLEWQICKVEVCSFDARAEEWRLIVRPLTKDRKFAACTYRYFFYDLGEISHRFQRLKQSDIVVDEDGEWFEVFANQ